MKKLLIFLSILLLLPISYAFSGTDSDILYYSDMDDASAPYKSDHTLQQSIDMSVLSSNPIEQQTPLFAGSTYSIQFIGDDVIGNTSVDMRYIINSTSISNGFTVGIWMKPTDTATKKGFGNNYYDGANKWNGWYIGTQTNKLTCAYANSGYGTGRTDASDIYTANDIFHVACKFNSSHVTIFVNGVQNRSVGYEATLTQKGPFYLTLGSTYYNGGYGSGFTGFLDEAWIVNRSLTQSEILDIYQNGIIFDTTDPVITVENNNFFNSGNTSMVFDQYDEFRFNITVNDTYLDEVWVNITNSSKQSLFQFDETGIAVSSYNFSSIVNLSLYPRGPNYKVNVRAVDSGGNIVIDSYQFQWSIYSVPIATGGVGGYVHPYQADDGPAEPQKKQVGYYFQQFQSAVWYVIHVLRDTVNNIVRSF